MNIRIVSVWWCLYVLSNTPAIFESQFMRSSATLSWVENSVTYKKVCISLVLLMIPPSSWCKSIFNLFFVPSWISSFFYLNGEKISFSRLYFVSFETVIWGLTFLMNFYKRVQLLFKKRQVSDFQKKISFVQKTYVDSHNKLLTLLFVTPDVKSYH